MAKKISYPAVQNPASKQDITKSYIQEYYAFQVEAGKISAEQLKEWVKIVKDAEAEHKDNPVKAFNVYRDKFVEKHFPQLNKKKEKSAAAYYESLLSKVEE
jgi:membrane-bound lytic murein transglycosylase B